MDYKSKDDRFYMKTNQGYVMKVVIELVQFFLKDNGTFFNNEAGLSLKGIDSDYQILVDLQLNKNEFESFYTDPINPLKIFKTNLIHLNRMVKPAKKKDHMSWCISGVGKEMSLSIECAQTLPSGTNTISKIGVQNAQAVELSIPNGYTHSIIIPSSDFQNLCKGINNVGKKFEFEAKEPTRLTMRCNGENVTSKEATFGECTRSNSIDPSYTPYKQTFHSSHITKLSKLAGLSKNFKLYIKHGLPLKVQLPVGQLGNLFIYIKSEEMVRDEQNNNDKVDDNESDVEDDETDEESDS